MPAERAEQKNKRSVKSKVLLLLIFVLIGVLGFSVYKFLSEYIPQQREQQQFSDLRKLIGEDEYEDAGTTDPSATTAADDTQKVLKKSKYDRVFSLYGDMCGWVWIDDTPIDYPVMKTDQENGEYYLHRDVDGDYSYAGCLFVGSNCDVDSDIFIIYGHNMNNGSMFGTLMDYADAGFLQAHRDICFDTKDERRVYRVFAAFDAMTYKNGDKTTAFKYYENIGKLDKASYDATLEHYRSLSWVWTGDVPSYPQQILLLSTCYTDKERFVVAAYRIQ